MYRLILLNKAILAVELLIANKLNYLEKPTFYGPDRT